MSSDEDHRDAVPKKKRRVQRACDMCRIKKRACDGLQMSTKKCTNCEEEGLNCTFAGVITKGRSYIELLESRLEQAEQTIRKLSAQSETSTNDTSSGSSQRIYGSPMPKHSNAACGPGVELAALAIRSMNTPAPRGDDIAEVGLLSQNMYNLSVSQHDVRYHGKSSSTLLFEATAELRQGGEEMLWPARRMHFWTFDPVKERSFGTGPYVFPEADLLSALVDLYFIHIDLYFPLLHRPTFERSVSDGLHLRDPSFGAVVLLVCANGSRFSDDPRVCGPGDEPLRCGWKYFDQVRNGFDHIFALPTLYNLQYYCLGVAFLQKSAPAPSWTMIGFGIRLAQDAGAHHPRNPGAAPTVESELWKRAFWVLICHDRISSTALGRPCTTQYEDFDVELPIECDDEFWENEDPARAFKQPADKPSQITFFNCFIRLNHILAFALKMLYSLNKAKSLLAVRDEAWEEHIVAELDSALNGWVDSIPSHLRWDPNRQDDNFFDQSAFLYCSYYQVQITIHRPFIPMIRKGASTALSSLAICTNAARSCAHVSDISRQRKNGTPVPVLVHATLTSALVLLLNIWSGKRTGLAQHMNSSMSEVRKCMACIRVCEKRWQSTGLFWDVIYELATVDEPPVSNLVAHPASAAESSSSSRAREDDFKHGYPSGGATVAHYPPYGNTYAPSAPPSDICAPHQQPQPLAPPQSAALPIYTADAHRLPVFHAYTQRSSWYPRQTSTAPLGYPDFSVGSRTSENAEGVYLGTGPLFPPDQEYPTNFAERVDTMSTDTVGIWANAPTGSQVNEWETYLSELAYGLGRTGPQT